MQYEIKSCPFYIMGLIFSLKLFINFDNYNITFQLYLVGIFAGLALFIAAIVLTILLIVQRDLIRGF